MDGIEIVASLDSGVFYRGERIGLRVTIQMPPGVHIYGQPLPDGYIPTSLEIAVPETIVVAPVSYPTPHPFRTDWLDEELMSYDGTITLTTALTFAEQREDLTITASLRFQVCTTEECYLPQRLTFTLPIMFQPFQ